jgi:hypothetical protein
VAGNGTTTPNCNKVLDSLGHNLTDDDSCGLTAPSDLVVADAMLGPLADNGGPTETHALLAGSPAIDAGSPDCPPPATDQRGVLRPQGAACDIGAFESEATPPGPADCLCQVKNILPDTINLNKVGTGGKQSSIDKRIIVQVRTVDAPGATCDRGETSGPQQINLKMVDDSGNVLIDSAKTFVCNGGSQQRTRTVPIEGPLNCKDSAVPDGFSSSVITATATAPGTGAFVKDLVINCTE